MSWQMVCWLAGCAALAACAAEMVEPPWVAPGCVLGRMEASGTTGSDAGPISVPGTPEEFVRLVMVRNWELRAAQARAAAMVERIPQATALDDPMSEIAPVGEMAHTAEGEVGLMLSVAQKFPFPGTLATRGEVARHEAHASGHEAHVQRVRVAADARRAWWDLYEADRVLEGTHAGRDTLARIREAAEARYRASLSPLDDVLRAGVELAMLDAELAAATRTREAAAARLRALADLPSADTVPQTLPLTADFTTPQTDQAVQTALVTHPRLAQVREMIRAGEQRQRLATLSRYPEFSAGVAYNAVKGPAPSGMPGGKDQWWLTFGVSIPLWQARGAAAQRQARQETWAAVAELSQEHNRIVADVHAAVARFEAHARRVAAVRESALPQTRQLFEASLAAYAGGAGDFITLLDHWRRLLELELAAHRAVADLARTHADLLEAMGVAEPATADAETVP